MKAGIALVQARRRAGLSQRELAGRAGVPQSTVARVESGSVDPTVSMLERLLLVCGERLEADTDITQGVDRSLIRAQLARMPRDRLKDVVAGAAFVRKLRGAARHA